MPGYLAISSLNASIHRFWLAAVGCAETTATSPLGSAPSSRISNCAPNRPIESLVAWLTKNGRPPEAVGVEGDDLGAQLLRALHRGNDRVRIARRHGDRRDVTVGEAVDDVDLRLGAGFRRAVILDLAAGLFGGDLGAGERGVVIRVGGRLDDHAQFEIGGHRGGRQRGDRHAGQKQFSKPVGHFSLPCVVSWRIVSGDRASR